MMSSADELAGSESVEELVRELVARVDQLEAERDALEERVAELERQPTLHWPDDDLSSLSIEHPEYGFELPIGATITSKVSHEDLDDHDEIESLQQDVQALKRGAVDELDLVTSAEADLPIETDVARAGDEQLRDDLTANELRAVKVFRKFGARSSSWSGTMRLESDEVATILEEEGEVDPNPNTVRRTMRTLAKKTSDQPKDERDPRAKDENLLWVAQGDKRLEVRADRDEFLDYMEEVEQRYSP